MNYIAKIFRKIKEKSSNQAKFKTIEELRDLEKVLVNKQNLLESKIQQELQTARKHGTNNKHAAKQALKRKKQYDKKLQHLDGTLSALEMQRETLQNAAMNTAILMNMKSAADAMKVAHQFKDIDNIQNMMDDIGDQFIVTKEISDATSKPLDIKEEELEKELEELDREKMENLLVKLPATPRDEPHKSSKITKSRQDSNRTLLETKL